MCRTTCFSQKNLRQRRKYMDIICRFSYTALVYKSNSICKLWHNANIHFYTKPQTPLLCFKNLCCYLQEARRQELRKIRCHEVTDAAETSKVLFLQVTYILYSKANKSVLAHIWPLPGISLSHVLLFIPGDGAQRTHELPRTVSTSLHLCVDVHSFSKGTHKFH